MCTASARNPEIVVELQLEQAEEAEERHMEARAGLRAGAREAGGS